MKVVINFKIDNDILDAAIRTLIYFKEKITKTSIKETIRKQIYSGGNSCVNFTELWGSDIFEADYDEELIDRLKNKYS